MIHRNNFDVLRLLFALMVIITHSVVLTGYGEADFLFKLTDGQTVASYIGVRGFFVISGYLVFKSLLRSTGPWDYMKKRLLRIFPGLLVMLAVVTLVAGPLITTLSAGAYFSNPATWYYPLSELRVFPVPHTQTLPGLFAGNPGGSAVNGSLWTVWFELMFYIGLCVFFLFRKWYSLLRILVAGGWLALFLFFLTGRGLIADYVFPMTGMSSEVVLDLLLYFMAGSALSFAPFQHSRGLRMAALAAGIILALAGVAMHEFFYLRYLALPLAVIGFGTMYMPALSAVRRLGEPSYGIYIYAYPVQQAVVQLLHPSPAVVTAITITIAMALGYASWHLVEKVALRWKKSA